MNAGTVIMVNGAGTDEAAVRVSSGADLQVQYDQLTALVLRMGAWLTGPKAQLLPRAAWEEQYARYGEQLEKLRDLGDRLRPVSLRPTKPNKTSCTRRHATNSTARIAPIWMMTV